MISRVALCGAYFCVALLALGYVFSFQLVAGAPPAEEAFMLAFLRWTMWPAEILGSVFVVLCFFYGNPLSRTLCIIPAVLVIRVAVRVASQF